jgi:hypothetical protein
MCIRRNCILHLAISRATGWLVDEPRFQDSSMFVSAFIF